MAEDHLPLRDLLTSTLERRGYEVIAARSCSSMLREIASSLVGSPVRLVVTDTIFRDGSGINAVATARRRGWQGPVLFVAPFADAEELRQARGVRKAMVLSRPFSGRQLEDWAAVLAPLPSAADARST